MTDQHHEAFAGMHQAGKIAAAALDMLGEYVAPGITTAKLDRLAFEFAVDHEAIPATLGYRGFKHAICTAARQSR